MALDYIEIPAFGNVSWKAPVANAASLPTIGNSPGDVRTTLDTEIMYVWTGSAWVAANASNSVTSLNGLTGALSILAGSGIQVNTSTPNITISANQNAVAAVELPFIASSAVTAYQMVIATSSTQAAPGNNNTTVQNASVLGIAKTGASMGNTFTALLFGTIVDASFSGFTINNPVYLNSSGFLTQTVPTTPNFMVNCGKYLGANTVLINIAQPVQL